MDAVLGNSLSVTRQLTEEEGVPADRLGLIYNGINSDVFAGSEARVALRASLGIGPEALVLCMTANLIPYKGHEDLIDALALAAKRMPEEWRLLLAGHDHGIGESLKNKAERLGLRKNISFLGSRTDIPALLAACDIGILCSHQEGFANAILEGMAARLPMIVTDVGGNSEAVVHGETGIVVPPKDPKRLSDAIIQLAQNQSLRSTYGAAGWQRVTEHFGMKRCVTLYDLLYRGLLAGKMPRDIPELRAS
jgi:glycosyltransferase involved in cell wall biosynthesis